MGVPSIEAYLYILLTPGLIHRKSLSKTLARRCRRFPALTHTPSIDALVAEQSYVWYNQHMRSILE